MILKTFEQKHAFMKFCEVLFARSNLMGTDFQDVVVNRIDAKFVQDQGGLRIEFSVSNHAVGKRLDEKMSEAFDAMFATD